jgi:Spy/CpxP family protein refolding chaperone
MTRRTVPLLAVLAAVACAAAVFAQQAAPQGPPGGRGPGRMGPMGPPNGPPPFPFDDLQVTDAQRDQILAIMQQHRTEGEPGGLAQLQRKLQQATFGGTEPDLAAIQQVEQEINAAEARMLRARIATQIEIAHVLTPEQKQTLLQMRPPMGAGREGMMAGGRRGRAGRIGGSGS